MNTLSRIIEFWFSVLLAGCIGFLVALIIQGIDGLKARFSIRRYWNSIEGRTETYQREKELKERRKALRAELEEIGDEFDEN